MNVFAKGEQKDLLTILESTPHSTGISYKCVCECGKKFTIGHAALVRRKSCGSCGVNFIFIDLTGERFGRWVVLKLAGKTNAGKHLWNCVCDCGTKRKVIGNNLVSKISKSCGCLKSEILHDINAAKLTGQFFGKLKVISKSNKTTGKQCWWMCKCLCGNPSLKELTSHQLLTGNTQSCGCKIHDTWRDRIVSKYMGEKFGRLTIVGVLPHNPNIIDRIVSCVCECGKQKEISLHAILQGITTSCGCRKIEEQIVRCQQESSKASARTGSQVYWAKWRGDILNLP